MTTNIETLREFLTENIDFFNVMPEGGSSPKLPKYDLYARDYIDFASKDLAQRDPGNILNCISNLKRALDCQVQTFFHVFGLERKTRNLSMPAKLEIIGIIGLLPITTLNKINSIRNAMEHEFDLPQIEIDTWFDLVATAVYA